MLFLSFSLFPLFFLYIFFFFCEHVQVTKRLTFAFLLVYSSFIYLAWCLHIVMSDVGSFFVGTLIF